MFFLIKASPTLKKNITEHHPHPSHPWLPHPQPKTGILPAPNHTDSPDRPTRSSNSWVFVCRQFPSSAARLVTAPRPITGITWHAVGIEPFLPFFASSLAISRAIGNGRAEEASRSFLLFPAGQGEGEKKGEEEEEEEVCICVCAFARASVNVSVTMHPCVSASDLQLIDHITF